MKSRWGVPIGSTLSYVDCTASRNWAIVLVVFGCFLFLQVFGLFVQCGAVVVLRRAFRAMVIP